MSRITNSTPAVLVSVIEAARRLGQPRHRLYRWITLGFFPSAAVRRLGRSIYIVWPEVGGWLVRLRGEAFPLDYATGDPPQGQGAGKSRTP
jgi:hypothetical protein